MSHARQAAHEALGARPERPDAWAGTAGAGRAVLCAVDPAPQQLRQLGDVGGDVPGFVLSQHNRRQNSSYFCMVISTADAKNSLKEQIVGKVFRLSVASDPIAGDELGEQCLIETALGLDVDVLDDGRLAQACELQSADQPLVLALDGLAVDHEREPLLEAECGHIGEPDFDCAKVPS